LTTAPLNTDENSRFTCALDALSKLAESARASPGVKTTMKSEQGSRARAAFALAVVDWQAEEVRDTTVGAFSARPFALDANVSEGLSLLFADAFAGTSGLLAGA
jgi:hypothetical protein